MSSPTLSRQRPTISPPPAPAPVPPPPPSLGGAVPAIAPTTESDRIRALEAEVEQLRSAMASRATIEQAKGILMLLTNCSDQVAFDLLAHISSHTHRKVRDIASSITSSACGTTALPDDISAIIRDACPPAARH